MENNHCCCCLYNFNAIIILVGNSALFNNTSHALHKPEFKQSVVLYDII